jgi:hypothetical protein
MHQTTVRFGSDLWEALEEECTRLGVSVAQYLREAALTRLVYAAGRRGDDEFQAALDLVAGSAAPARLADTGAAIEALASHRKAARTAAQERAVFEGSESAAVVAQGRLARERSRVLRERVEHDRAELLERAERDFKR